METLIIALLALVLYLAAYHTYGRWLCRKVFKLDPAAEAPSKQLEDGEDYVPTDKMVVFGHHFTSIAGTGPIVGPALAVMWGWLPALVWVLVGSIFIGAVHDLASLVISMRNRGQTVGEIAGRVLNPRVKILFLSLLFFALTVVLAVFGLVIAKVFVDFPSSIFPCLAQIPLAMVVGTLIHRKGRNLAIPSIICLGLMYLSVWYGDVGLLHSFNSYLSAWPVLGWVAFMLIYSYGASVMPVWLLLQPRDYINSLQLLSMLGLIVAGLVAAAFLGGPTLEDGGHAPLKIIAPMVETGRSTPLPLMIPFLFITIACGAISGFHCLVSSGTTSKQMRSETDAHLVGYGSMLTEGFLAVVVILACVAGLSLGVVPAGGGPVLTGDAAWAAKYGSWAAASAGALSAFVQGAGNFLRALGIPAGPATAFIGVLVASFAATTMDTACRLHRYVIQELASSLLKGPRIGQPTDVKRTANPLTWLCHPHEATLLAIGCAALLAAMPMPGKEWTLQTAGGGGLLLWPLFGATNQLLGGLAFLVILFWMARRNMPTWFIIPPAMFMLLVPAWALGYQLFVQGLGSDTSWLKGGQWVLCAFAVVTLLLEIWMVVEALLAWPKIKGVLEPGLPPLPARRPTLGGATPS